MIEPLNLDIVQKKKLKIKMNNKIKIIIILFVFILINWLSGFLNTGQAFLNYLAVAILFWIIIIIEGYYKHEK
jgi:purine-cytosine permease-like protein